jgi:hypothetical protein
MIDDDIVRIARNRARIEIARQEQQLKDAIGRVNAGAAAEGVGGSSIPLLRIAELCATAAIDRGDIVWRVLHRVVAAAGVRYEPYLESELKSVAHEFLSPTLQDLRDIPREAAIIVGIAPIIPHLEGIVSEGQRIGRERAWNEIEIFVAYLRSVEAHPQPGSQAVTLNVYAPIGAIQTGDGSQAIVVQGIDADLRRRLAGVLESLERQVPHCVEMPPEARAKALEVIRETRAEASQPEPDRHRLAALLMAAAAAIRAVATLKPALDALKGLIEALGMHLPW